MSATVPQSRILATERFQLMVRTGDCTMDHLLYAMVYQQFSDVLPLREKEPYTGTFEVTYASAGQRGVVGTSSPISNATAQGSGWYTGSTFIGHAVATGSSSTVTTGSTFQWQNSTMLMVLKHGDGDRLWSADYNYKGGWELSGFVVNTPEEAARLVTRRLKDRFAADIKRQN